MISITQALTTALFHFVWQGAVIAALLWVVLTVLRNASPRVRYAVACSALAAMAVLPVVTGYRTLSDIPGPISASSPPLPGPGYSLFESSDFKGAGLNWIPYLRDWALPVWIAGVLFFSLRLIWTGRQIAALRKSAETADESISATVRHLVERLHLTRRVRLSISRLAEGPAVVGWVKPMILIPAASVAGLSPEQLEAVLAHEVAHIWRHDHIVNMMQVVIETFLFYHPAVWWTSACIRRERELCCDDIAVSLTGNNVTYARALVRLERMRLSSTTLALAAAEESLGYRIRRIVGEADPKYSQSRVPGIVALSVCLALAAVAVNASRMQSQAAQQPASSKPALSATVVETPEGSKKVFVRQGPVDAPGVTVEPGAAEVVHRNEVGYPEAAWTNGIEGTVTLQVSLDTNGSVADARVLAGPIELRRASLQSVLQWHFALNQANSTQQVAIRFDSKAAASGFAGRVEAKRKAEDDLAALLSRPQTDQSKEATLKEIRALTLQLQAESNDKRIAELKTKLDAVKVLDQPRTISVQGRQSSLSGRTLTAININGVAESYQSTLVSKVAVKIGDVLSEDSIADIEKKVHAFDEHLVATFVMSGENEVTLNISPRQ